MGSLKILRTGARFALESGASAIANFSAIASFGEKLIRFVLNHCRLKKGQTVRQYYDEKKCLGTLSELKNQHIVSDLTDGLRAWGHAFAGMVQIEIKSNQIESFTVAQHIESSRARSKSYGPLRDNSGIQRCSMLQTPTKHREQCQQVSAEFALHYT